MLRKRIIPCLLLKGKGLVKTVNFKNPVYLGDPLNVINIFNQKMVDELMILDIMASAENSRPNFEFIQKLSSRSFSPITYGGGIKSLADAEQLFKIGVEKVCLNTAAFNNPALLVDMANNFGSQSVVVSINVSKNLFGKYRIVDNSAKKEIGNQSVQDTITWFQNQGAGEVLINDVSNDGVMKGYDIDMLRKVSSNVSIPVIACGGCGNLDHIKELLDIENIAAAAAGSFFVFNGRHKAVLITYPSRSEINKILNSRNENM
jgi:imidazole glycerol-phosphate synthase subunit HisF